MTSVDARVVPFDSVRRSPAWSDWRALTRDAPPFLTPEFFALNGPLSHQGEALLAQAWEQNGLVGALPLSLSHRTLEGLRSDQTPGFDYWGSAEGLSAIWRAILRDGRWDVMVLKNVPKESALATTLVTLAEAEGCRVALRSGARHPYFELSDFEARLSPKFRQNLKRCGRKAGGVELERLTSPTRSELEEALTLEAMAWKGAAGTSIATDPEVAHLYGAVTRLFGRRGRAALSFLRANGRRIALLFSVEDDHTLYALKIGYDPSQAAVSPGHLMVWKVAEDAEERGLRQLDFVGRADDWKKKWTDVAHEQVSVLVYRRSPRGLLAWTLHEQLKPRLPAELDLRSPLRHGCQRDDIIGEHTASERVRGRVDRGLGIKSGIRRAFAPAPPPRDPLGAPSRFAPGSWVRVLDEARVRSTLDASDRLRGLAFGPSQWPTCGQVYRVAQQVRRLRDDQGRMRPVSRTVLLEGVTCAGAGPEPTGCGRHCPMMYRDDWLEPAEAPRREPPSASTLPHARVRSLEEIQRGLDLEGRRDGVTFMPEMARFAGKRLRILERLDSVFEYDKWTPPRARVFLLEDARCTGQSLGARGPCDRSCALVWHEDWLALEPNGSA